MYHGNHARLPRARTTNEQERLKSAMFLPLEDSARLRTIRFQAMTAALIAINVVIFLSMQLLPASTVHNAQLALGAIPAVLTGHAVLAEELQWMPSALSPVTSLFLHGGWMHLIGNMLFLWVFADNVEDALGHFWFLAFYLVCGLAGVALHLLLQPHSQLPLIGASGAISGVLAAYLVLFPRSRITALIFNIVPVRLSAIWLLVAWILYQMIFLIIDPHGGVAWGAHVGGFLAGLALVGVFRERMRRRLLLGRPRSRPVPPEEGHA